MMRMKNRFFLLAAALLWNSCQSSKPADSITRFSPDHDAFVYTGRFLDLEEEKLFAWSASRISFRFKGDSICLHMDPDLMQDTDQADLFDVILDGKRSVLSVYPQTPIWLKDLGASEHSLILLKRTEASVSAVSWKGVSGGTDLKLILPAAVPRISMEVIGNSITCGYGNEGPSESCTFSPETENALRTYASMAAEALGLEYHAVCYSGKGVWRNYGKDTTELMPELWHRYLPQRAELYPHNQKRDIVLVNLGTNDFAHEIPPRGPFVSKYVHLIRAVREVHPEAKIVMLTGSMMQGNSLQTLTAYLQEVKMTLEGEGIEELYRFDLSPQGELGYGCSWHPNVAQHTKNAQELAVFLSNIL